MWPFVAWEHAPFNGVPDVPIRQAKAKSDKHAERIAIQSLNSALRLKLGWTSSIAPPNALAPRNTGSRPMRPVRANGNASAAKAIKCTSLSLPLGARGGLSKGQSIATVTASVTISVRGISRYLRTSWCVSIDDDKGKQGLLVVEIAAM